MPLVLAPVWLASGLWLAAEPRTPAQDPASKTFSHVDHVPKLWVIGDETQRDCRGCHDYDPRRRVEPQQVCSSCHAKPGDTFSAEWEAGYERDLAPLRDEGTPEFLHPDHASIACKECHLKPGATSVPATMPIDRGVASCVRCHDVNPQDRDYLSAPGAEPIDADRLHERLIARLNQSDQMAPNALGAFRHAEHLANPRAGFAMAARNGPTDTCSTCHEAACQSDGVGLGLARFASGACKSCHHDAAKNATLGFAQEPRASLAAHAFAHSDHLRGRGPDPAICAAEHHASVQAKACTVCHGPVETTVFNRWPPDPDREQGREADWSYPADGAPPAWEYGGCVVCHTPQAWKTKDHGDWGDCTQCHTFGQGSMQRDRPQAEGVRRASDVEWVILSHAHPHITKGNDEQQDCRECHRAALPELPSRLGKRRFSHATHLPPPPSNQGDPGPTDADCLECHRGVESADESAALGFAVPGAPGAPGGVSWFRTYDLKACDRCHGNGRVARVPRPPDSAVTPRSVPVFSHADHVGKQRVGGAAITCVTCHTPRTERSPRMDFAAGVLDCTACHDHDSTAERWKNTGQIHGTDVTSCGNCHASIPALEPPQTPHAVLAGGVGRQHHPAGQACGTCHVVQTRDVADDRRDHVRSRVPSRHPPQPANCLGCHWHVAARGAGVQDPTNPQVRGALGNDLTAYPGEGATSWPR